MSEATKRSDSGPYFNDMDGDTIIIGPGINADAPVGCELVDELVSQILASALDYGGTDDEADEAREEIIDLVLPLLNLAYREGAKSK